MKTLLYTTILLFISFTISSQNLIVEGNNEALRIEGTQSWISFYNGATRRGYLQHEGPDMWLVNEQLGNIYFRTENKTRMTITPYGDVEIGQTSLAGRLIVRSANAAVVGISSQNNGVYGSSGCCPGVYGNSSNADAFDFLAVTSDGSNGYGEISSIRWKTNIRNIDDPIIKLSNLRGVYYNWKEEFGGSHALGFIAEEVGKVLPEIVVYEENGIDAVGLDYGKMTPLLVEAANAMRKEYQEKFDHQQSNISRQQSEIDALKQDMAELKSHFKAQVNNASED